MAKEPTKTAADARRRKLASHVSARARLGIACLLLGVGLGLHHVRHVVRGPSFERSLGTALERDEGLALVPGSLVLLDGEPSALRYRGAVFLARQGDAPADLYFGAVRGAGTVLLHVAGVTDVTRTPGAAEEAIVRIGDRLAYLSLVRGSVEAVTVVDLRGEPDGLTRSFSRIARLQHAISNVQETGRPSGFGRVRYAFDRPLVDARLAAEEGVFVVRGGDLVVRLDPSRETPLEGAEHVRHQPQEIGEPGGIPWIVDTVRNLSFVGPEPIAWLEHRVYAVKDWAQRMRYRYLGGSVADEDVEAELGVQRPTQASVAEAAQAVEEIGFPPRRLVPVVPDPSPGEGEWIAIVDDPFVGSYPKAMPAFAQTHLRVDSERPFARVFLVAMDPRQVQLRMVSGTREPESANGATGSGLIPRDPETLPLVVGAFNGGFQAMHGEFGMMADGTVYLPPKPFAATVGVYEDGEVVLGSWLGLPEGRRAYTEEAAIAQIPAGMIELRQNLTSVVEGGAINPWQRWYWGAAPLNAQEQTFVDRSGLCLTEEGFLVYFWGVSMGSDQLGEAMKRARCVRGMHLDMNSKHTAFEFYNVRPASSPFPALGRPLGEAEFETRVPEITGFVVRGRKAASRMDPMRFPRYIERDPRDYFYLQLRPTLPGPDLVGVGEGGAFRTDRLPQAGYPFPFARAAIGGEGRATHVVRIDPSRAMPAPVDARERRHGTRELAALVGAQAVGPVSLLARRAGTGLRYVVGTPAANDVVVASGDELGPTSAASAALGVDVDGFLVYLERAPGDPSPLHGRLAAARVTRALALPDGCRLVFLGAEGGYGPDGTVRERGPGLVLLAREQPYAEVLFPEVAPRPYAEWGRIQDSRVRYIPDPTGPRRFNRPPEAQ
ncbi:MAG: hypothetical protein U0230_07670 [Polyangiales bacterium]